jgi:peptidoglycan/LPS O-acetylase OafA/YrhL/lysophospholipase L1-like esterase
MSEPDSRRIPYQPALDGLRAIAVLGVIAYHAGIDWMRGGFLGVSTFFTLSGFLITALLVREHVNNGAIALRRFWSRRFRRLLPAAIVTIIATVFLVAAIGDDSQLSRLRVDALASLLHFSNWRFVAAGDSYGALFESPSYFRHFWSLAVEEQYYLVVPVLIAGALRLAGGPTRRFRIGLAVVVAAALAWPVLLLANGASTDRIYFGTDGRLGELLVGAALALWWTGRDQQIVSEGARSLALDAAAVGSIVAMAWWWTTAQPGDRFLYQGGLALHAVLTSVVIVAVVNPHGLLRRALGAPALVSVGVISYGMYLLHWPILLWLGHATELDPVGRFVVGTGLSIVAARAMYVAVERPIRSGRLAPRAAPWTAIPATATAALLIFAVSAWRQPEQAPIDFAAAQAQLDELTATPTDGIETDVAGAIELAPEAAERQVPQVAAFGDSTALMTGLGLAQWAAEHPDRLEIVRGDAKLGCGLLTGGTRRLEGREFVVPEACDQWLEDWLAALDANQPVDADGVPIPLDAAVVQLGAWEIVDHQLTAGAPFTSILDADHAAQQEARLAETIDALAERAERVILIAHPDVGEARLAALPSGVSYPEYDPARSARWRDMLTAAAESPVVDIVDLASHIDTLGTDDLRIRPDGVHFSQETGAEIAEWLGPAILAVVGEVETADDPPNVPTSTPTSEPVPPKRILLAGDSLMLDASFALLAVLDTAEPAVVGEFVGQATRARTAEQRSEWLRRVEEFGPDIVVEYFGYWEFAAAGFSNPGIGSDGFDEAYRREVLDPWFDELEALGTDVIVLGAAPSGNPTVDPNIDIALEIVATVAAERPSVVFLATAEVLAPDGHTHFLPDPRTGETERVRRIDGLHLCPDGAERVADLLVDHLGAAYDLRFDTDAAVTGWRVGEWRDALPVDLARECPPVAP